MTAITAVEYVNLRKFLNQIALLFFYWNCIPANIRLDEDVFRLRLQKTSSGRLDQDEYIYLTYTSSEDVFKMSSRRLDQDQYICLGHTSSRRLQNVFKTSSRRLAETSSVRLQDVFKTFWRRVQDVFQTSSKYLAKASSRRFQDVSPG